MPGGLVPLFLPQRCILRECVRLFLCAVSFRRLLVWACLLRVIVREHCVDCRACLPTCLFASVAGSDELFLGLGALRLPCSCVACVILSGVAGAWNTAVTFACACVCACVTERGPHSCSGSGWAFFFCTHVGAHLLGVCWVRSRNARQQICATAGERRWRIAPQLAGGYCLPPQQWQQHQ